MPSGIIVGNGAQAKISSHSGWVVGHFMKEALAYNTDLEIKVWEYSAPPEYGLKRFGGTEFIIVERGALRLEVIPPGEKEPRMIDLEGDWRDYTILPPNCQKRVIVTRAPAAGLCVRWPSADGLNQVE